MRATTSLSQVQGLAPQRFAHHIVAWGAKGAEDARDILSKLKIDINGKVNGAALTKAKHKGLHTKAYYKKVNERIAAAYNNGEGTKRDVERALEKIGKELADGTFMK